MMRNILDACPKALQGELHGRLRLVFEAPDIDTTKSAAVGVRAVPTP